MISLTDSPTINTQYGRVRGRTYTFTDSQHSVSAFLGIPYAKPPIGDLRFQVYSKKNIIIVATKK